MKKRSHSAKIILLTILILTAAGVILFFMGKQSEKRGDSSDLVKDNTPSGYTPEYFENPIVDTYNDYSISYKEGFTDDDRNLIDLIGALWAQENDNRYSVVVISSCNKI